MKYSVYICRQFKTKTMAGTIIYLLVLYSIVATIKILTLKTK